MGLWVPPPPPTRDAFVSSTSLCSASYLPRSETRWARAHQGTPGTQRARASRVGQSPTWATAGRCATTPRVYHPRSWHQRQLGACPPWIHDRRGPAAGGPACAEGSCPGRLQPGAVARVRGASAVPMGSPPRRPRGWARVAGPTGPAPSPRTSHMCPTLTCCKHIRDQSRTLHSGAQLDQLMST